MATYYMWTGSGVTARQNSTTYSNGDRIVPLLTDTAGNAAVAKRWVWEVTAGGGGQSGAGVPVWPATVNEGQTLTDGALTLTARIPGYSAGGTTQDWSFATIYFLYALLAANANGDIILIHKTSQESLTATTTWAAAANISIFSVDKDNNSAISPMGTGGWLGQSTTTGSQDFTFNGAFKVFTYGVTFRVGGNDVNNLTLASSDGSHFEFENCYFWMGATNSGASTNVGQGVDENAFAKFVECTFRFASTGHQIDIRSGRFIFERCYFATIGSVPTILFNDADTGGGADIEFLGCDLSPITNTLVDSFSFNSRTFKFVQCKINATTILATQTPANKSSGVVYLFDCNNGNVHTYFAYHDSFGSCVSDTGIYYTTGSSGQSWRITTNPTNCSYYTPFQSPFVDLYHTGTSSITPYFEILRSGSLIPFQDDEIWAEFFVKTTANSVQSSIYTDRMALLGVAANQASGAGNTAWTGELANSWSGKIDTSSSVIPTAPGAIRGRITVGEPNITVYVDPQIRI